MPNPDTGSELPPSHTLQILQESFKEYDGIDKTVNLTSDPLTGYYRG